MEIKSLKSRDKSKEQYWVNLLQDWQASNLSGAQYCREHQINKAQFGYWKHKIFYQRTPAEENNSFAKVVIVEDEVKSNKAKAQDKGIEIILPSGYVIKVPCMFHADTLEKIIEVLRK